MPHASPLKPDMAGLPQSRVSGQSNHSQITGVQDKAELRLIRPKPTENCYRPRDARPVPYPARFALSLFPLPSAFPESFFLVDFNKTHKEPEIPSSSLQSLLPRAAETPTTFVLPLCLSEISTLPHDTFFSLADRDLSETSSLSSATTHLTTVRTRYLQTIGVSNESHERYRSSTP